MAKFAVGDTVRLTREVDSYPAGTVGTIERVEESGWIKVIIDSTRTGRFIMTKERWGDIEKIEREEKNKMRWEEEVNDEGA